MKTALSFLILALAFSSLSAEASCVPGTEGACGDPNICISANPRARSGRHDKNSCLPGRVCNALKTIAHKFGKVEIASAMRVNNASRGGAKNSWHKTCGAADFLVPGFEGRQRQQELADLLKTLNVGKNVYCTGRAHVSLSPREYFYSSCVATGKHRAARKHR